MRGDARDCSCRGIGLSSGICQDVFEGLGVQNLCAIAGGLLVHGFWAVIVIRFGCFRGFSGRKSLRDCG